MGKSQSRQQQSSENGSNHCLEYDPNCDTNPWYIVGGFENDSYSSYWVYDDGSGSRNHYLYPVEEYPLEEEQGYEDNLVMVAPIVETAVEEALVCGEIDNPEELDSIPDAIIIR